MKIKVMEIKVMEINDLLKSKEALKRKRKNAYLDRFDITSLKEILKQQKNKRFVPLKPVAL